MKAQFKEILKEHNVKSAEVAEKLGLSLGSYRVLTRASSGSVPKWVRGFMLGYELGLREGMIEKKSSASHDG